MPDCREQDGVNRGHPERGVVVPEHPVGAVVLPAAVDLSIAVPVPAAGDRLGRDPVRSELERADLVPVEDAAQDKYPIAVELPDLLGGKHLPSSLLESIPTWRRR